jgi:putative inorganic carbon (HCO3(-)) transporter
MLAFAGVSFLCILTTLSRGAVLGAFLAILILSIVKREKWVLLTLLAVVLIGPFFLPANAKQWAKEVRYNPVVILFNQDRLSIYQNTLNMIKHHPLTGVGVNTFSRNYSRYKLASVEKQAVTKDSWYGHNIYLHMAGEIGLLGLASFLAFLFFGFKTAVNHYRKIEDKFLKAVALSVVACLAGFLINGLTESNLYYPKVAMIFWYLFGISFALKQFCPAPQAAERTRAQ